MEDSYTALDTSDDRTTYSDQSTDTTVVPFIRKSENNSPVQQREGGHSGTKEVYEISQANVESRLSAELRKNSTFEEDDENGLIGKLQNELLWFRQELMLRMQQIQNLEIEKSQAENHLATYLREKDTTGDSASESSPEDEALMIKEEKRMLELELLNTKSEARVTIENLKYKLSVLEEQLQNMQGLPSTDVEEVVHSSYESERNSESAHSLSTPSSPMKTQDKLINNSKIESSDKEIETLTKVLKEKDAELNFLKNEIESLKVQSVQKKPLEAAGLAEFEFGSIDDEIQGESELQHLVELKEEIKVLKTKHDDALKDLENVLELLEASESELKSTTKMIEHKQAELESIILEIQGYHHFHSGNAKRNSEVELKLENEALRNELQKLSESFSNSEVIEAFEVERKNLQLELQSAVLDKKKILEQLERVAEDYSNLSTEHMSFVREMQEKLSSENITDIISLKAHLEILQEEQICLKDENATMTKELEMTSKTLKETLEQRDDLAEKLYSLKNNFFSTTESPPRENMSTRCEHLNSLVVSMCSKLEEILMLNDEASSIGMRRMNVFKELIGDFNESNFDRVMESLEEINIVEITQKNLVTVLSERDELRVTLEEATEKKDALESSLESIKLNNDLLKSELTGTLNQNELLMKELEDIVRQNETITNDCDSLAKEILLMKEKLQDAQKERGIAELERDNLTKTLEEYMSPNGSNTDSKSLVLELEQKNNQINSLNEKMKQFYALKVELETNMIELDQSNREKHLLQDEMNHVVHALEEMLISSNNKSELLEKLKEENKKKEQIIENNAEVLFSFRAIVDNMEAELSNKKDEILKKDKIIETKAEELSSFQGKIDNIRAELMHKTDELMKKDQIIENHTEELSGIRAMIDNMPEELTRKVDEILKKEQISKGHTEKLSYLQVMIDIMQADRTEKADEILKKNQIIEKHMEGLSRLQTIIDNMQADRTEKANEILKKNQIIEKHTEELSWLRKMIDTMQAERTEEANELLKKSQIIEKHTEALSSLQTMINNIQAEQTEKAHEILKLQDSLKKVSKEREELVDIIRRHSEDLQELEEEKLIRMRIIDELNEKQNTHVSKISELESFHRDNIQKIGDLKNEIAEIMNQKEAMAGKVLELDFLVEEKQEKLDEYELCICRHEDQVKDLEAVIARQQENLQEALEGNDVLKLDLEGKENQLQVMEEQNVALAATAERVLFTEGILKQKILQLNEELEDLRKDISKFQSDGDKIVELEQQNSCLENENKSLSGKITEFESMVTHLESALKDTTAILKENEMAKRELEKIIYDNEAYAVLEKENAATLAEEVTRLSNLLKNAEHKNEKLEVDLSQARICEKICSNMQKSLESELATQKEQMKATEDELLMLSEALEVELENVKASLNEKEMARHLLEKHLNEQKEHMATSEHEMAVVAKALKDSEIEVIKLQKALTEKNIDLEESRERVEALQRNLDFMEKEVERLLEKATSAEDQMNVVSSTLDEARKRMLDIELELQESRVALTENEAVKTDVQFSLEATRNELEEQKAKVALAEYKLSDLSKLLEDAENKELELNIKMNESSSIIANKIAIIQRMEMTIKSINQEYHDLKEAALSTQEEMKTLTERLSKANDKVSELEAELNDIKSSPEENDALKNDLESAPESKDSREEHGMNSSLIKLEETEKRAMEPHVTMKETSIALEEKEAIIQKMKMTIESLQQESQVLKEEAVLTGEEMKNLIEKLYKSNDKVSELDAELNDIKSSPEENDNLKNHLESEPEYAESQKDHDLKSGSKDLEGAEKRAIELDVTLKKTSIALEEKIAIIEKMEMTIESLQQRSQGLEEEAVLAAEEKRKLSQELEEADKKVVDIELKLKEMTNTLKEIEVAKQAFEKAHNDSLKAREDFAESKLNATPDANLSPEHETRFASEENENIGRSLETTLEQAKEDLIDLTKNPLSVENHMSGVFEELENRIAELEADLMDSKVALEVTEKNLAAERKKADWAREELEKISQSTAEDKFRITTLETELDLVRLDLEKSKERENQVISLQVELQNLEAQNEENNINIKDPTEAISALQNTIDDKNLNENSNFQMAQDTVEWTRTILGESCVFSEESLQNSRNKLLGEFSSINAQIDVFRRHIQTTENNIKAVEEYFSEEETQNSLDSPFALSEWGVDEGDDSDHGRIDAIVDDVSGYDSQKEEGTASEKPKVLSNIRATLNNVLLIDSLPNVTKAFKNFKEVKQAVDQDERQQRSLATEIEIRTVGGKSTEETISKRHLAVREVQDKGTILLQTTRYLTNTPAEGESDRIAVLEEKIRTSNIEFSRMIENQELLHEELSLLKEENEVLKEEIAVVKEDKACLEIDLANKLELSEHLQRRMKESEDKINILETQVVNLQDEIEERENETLEMIKKVKKENNELKNLSLKKQNNDCKKSFRESQLALSNNHDLGLHTDYEDVAGLSLGESVDIEHDLQNSEENTNSQENEIMRDDRDHMEKENQALREKLTLTQEQLSDLWELEHSEPDNERFEEYEGLIKLLHEKNAEYQENLEEQGRTIANLTNFLEEKSNLLENSAHSLKAFEARILFAEDHLKKKDELIDTLIADINEKTVHLEEKSKEVEKFRNKIEEVHGEKQDIVIALDKANLECVKLTEANELLESKVEVLTSQELQFQRRLKEYQNTLASLNEFEILTEKHRNALDDIETARRLLEQEQQSNANKAQELENLKTQLARVEADLDATRKLYEKEIEVHETAKHRLKSADSDIKGLKSKRVIDLEEIDSLRTEIEKLNLELIEKGKAIEDINALYLNAMDEKEIAGRELDSLKYARDYAQGKVTSLNADLSELRVQHEALKRELKSIEETRIRVMKESEDLKRKEGTASLEEEIERLKAKVAGLEISESTLKAKTFRLENDITCARDLSTEKLAEVEILKRELDQLRSEQNISRSISVDFEDALSIAAAVRQLAHVTSRDCRTRAYPLMIKAKGEFVSRITPKIKRAWMVTKRKASCMFHLLNRSERRETTINA